MQERLNRIVREKGLTAGRFAQEIGASPSAISHILSGRNKPGYEVLYSIARVFPDIDPGWLLTGEGPMYRNESPEDSGSTSHPTPQQAQQPQESQRQPSRSLFDWDEVPTTPAASPIIPPVRQPATTQPAQAPQTTHAQQATVEGAPTGKPGKTIKRIILFLADGTFEEYHN